MTSLPKPCIICGEPCPTGRCTEHRKVRPMNPKYSPSRTLQPLVGHRIPGGCDDCNAHQKMTHDPHTGIYHLTVHHDATCPWLALHEGRR